MTTPSRATLARSSHPASPPVGSWYEGRRIVVTGAGGYLAAAIVRALKDWSCRIIRVARPGTTLASVPGVASIEDVCGDVGGREAWERVVPEADVVFHLAAQTSASAANADPALDLAANVAPMLHLLETCRHLGSASIVVFASTVTIAGIPHALPVDEAHPDRPTTVYDLHKLMAEQYLKYYATEGVVRGASLRLANVFGPGPRSSQPDRGVLNRMIRKALAGETLTVYGSGDRVRDYLYVDDAAEAFLEAGRHGAAVHGQHFVIGSERGCRIDEAVRLVAERVMLRSGRRVTVERIAPPSPQLSIEARDFVADCARFRSLTGWRARHALTDGIDRTIEALVRDPA